MMDSRVPFTPTMSIVVAVPFTPNYVDSGLDHQPNITEVELNNFLSLLLGSHAINYQKFLLMCLTNLSFLAVFS